MTANMEPQQKGSCTSWLYIMAVHGFEKGHPINFQSSQPNTGWEGGGDILGVLKMHSSSKFHQREKNTAQIRCKGYMEWPSA
jgi:hypothetical protein